MFLSFLAARARLANLVVTWGPPCLTPLCYNFVKPVIRSRGDVRVTPRLTQNLKFRSSCKRL